MQIKVSCSSIPIFEHFFVSRRNKNLQLKEKKEDKVKKDYRITIGGRDLSFDTLVTHEEAMHIIKTISEIKGK